jgi:hypothetical protein
MKDSLECSYDTTIKWVDEKESKVMREIEVKEGEGEGVRRKQ